MKALKYHPVLRYSADIIKLSSPLELLDSYIIYETTVPLKLLGGGGLRAVVFSSHGHEVLKLSLCDLSMSVVRLPLYVVRLPSFGVNNSM